VTPRPRSRRPERSTAERVSFAISSAVVLVVAVAVVALGIRDSRPPDLTASLVGQPRTSGSQTYVSIEVRNDGTEAAEEVQVVAEKVEGGEPMPVGEQVVSFLAGGHSVTVVLVLDSADITGLTVRVDSYTASR